MEVKETVEALDRTADASRSVLSASVTPSGSRRDGPNCREQERQQQSTGQHVCGIVTTNAGYRHQRKERRLQRAGVSKMKGSGARSALKIWISEEWGDLRRVLGARTFFFEKG